jgi:Protein of unknown function (DUF4238)
MGNNAPRKIHTVTRAYLAAWAPPPGRLLQPNHTSYGRQKLASPAGTGYALDWWGDDPALNAACETACMPLESSIPKVLATIGELWPLKEPTDGSGSPRGLLAQFMALHALRTEAAKDWLVAARENSLDDMRRKWAGRVEFAKFEERARSDEERARSLIRMVNKIATILGSMNWTLLRFDEPWLITADHPVCPVPLMDVRGDTGVAAMPPDGWANVLEVRFPISPYLGLLCCWQLAPDPPIVSGTWDYAANFNAGVKAQAEERWFQVPGPMPPFPGRIHCEVDPLLPALAPRFFPGYDSAAARASGLRAAVLKQVEEIVEKQDDSTMCIVRPEPTLPGRPRTRQRGASG